MYFYELHNSIRLTTTQHVSPRQLIAGGKSWPLIPYSSITELWLEAFNVTPRSHPGHTIFGDDLKLGFA